MPQTLYGLLGSDCPSPLCIPINLWNFQTWKFHRASSVIHQCRQISDYQAFQSTEQSSIIHSDNFVLHLAKLGM